MRVTATTEAAGSTAADTIVVGLLEDEAVVHDVEDGVLQALVDAGEARAKPRSLAVAHAAGKRWILVGLGARASLDAEALRVAAAVAHGRARDLGARTLCWELPHKAGEIHPARAVVEGTLMAAYAFRAFKTKGSGNGDGDGDENGGGIEELIVSDHEDRTAAVARAVTVTEAVNAARDLQNTPANAMTPTALGERARSVAAAHPDTLSCEVEGRDGIVARGMGAFAAVAQGSDEEPALITLRYEPPAAPADGVPVLGLVGKGVTFDSGGLSIKPAGSMVDMKYDMTGGAAVIEALGAIAALELPVRVVGVVGATENLLGGRAMKPGDVFTSASGLTVQVDNTDAEGRLVLADCLHHAIGQGAQRLVDVATLTGAIMSALGRVYAGFWADDEAWAAQVAGAAAEGGDLIWRMPLHDRYAELVKGSTADVANMSPPRTGAACTAAEFLHNFTGGVPWAHLDICGTAWDSGRAYAPKGGTGTPVRTLVALAERVSRG
ncbi:MAG TPA: leucyl aminopeptidase [Baekduia sp.]|uniref:leucyl aminopeptidase family protein n=1 Tax=Baekduia sp. TaxID=2600305 RepID=UPI002D79FCC2|nr:leucyl aminopeptidase [Baekduia sp.]HET6506659.1 leucyl aminopeptidase [Baekduia sp.]